MQVAASARGRNALSPFQAFGWEVVAARADPGAWRTTSTSFAGARARDGLEAGSSDGRPGAGGLAGGRVAARVIVEAEPTAVGKFAEFFAGRIANERTRAAYARAAGQFLRWCEARGLRLEAVSPLHVAAYIRNSSTTPSSRARTIERLFGD